MAQATRTKGPGSALSELDKLWQVKVLHDPFLFVCLFQFIERVYDENFGLLFVANWFRDGSDYIDEHWS